MRGLLALGLGVLFVGGVAGGGDAKTDSAKLQGKWVGEWKDEKVELTFAKDTFTFDVVDKAVFKGTVKLDSKKKPKEMDLKITEAPMFEGKTANCIYELKGDTFKWCGMEPGDEGRPKSFKEDEPKHMSITFKRVK